MTGILNYPRFGSLFYQVWGVHHWWATTYGEHPIVSSSIVNYHDLDYDSGPDIGWYTGTREEG